MPHDTIEFETAGAYLGECRLRFSILEQWTGESWRRVPDVVDRRLSPAPKLHFDVEDALCSRDDSVGTVFRPR